MAFGLEQYERMAELFRSMKSKAAVSLNDHPEMRRAFAGLTQRTLTITDSVGSAEHRSTSLELVVSSFWFAARRFR